MPYIFGIMGPFGRLIALWCFTLIVLVMMYRFSPAIRKVSRLQAQLERVDRELRQAQTTGSKAERLLFLRQELSRLTDVSATVMLDHDERSQMAKSWRDKAESILEQGENAKLSEAQSLLASVNELILLEKRELVDQKLNRNLALIITLLFIVGICAIAFWARNLPPTEAIPLFNLPLSVVMWGALGSLAAILYRFYTVLTRSRFDWELRWLIARPIIGIVMGGISYLAVKVGLLLVNTATGVSNESPQLPSKMELYWIVAFLAGFSDKFYVGIVDLLVEKALGRESNADSKRADAQTLLDDQTVG